MSAAVLGESSAAPSCMSIQIILQAEQKRVHEVRRVDLSGVIVPSHYPFCSRRSIALSARARALQKSFRTAPSTTQKERAFTFLRAVGRALVLLPSAGKEH